MIDKRLTIWLAYVGFPITTAVYLERSLRKFCNVVTIGPELPQEVVAPWGLEDLDPPTKRLDIDTSFMPDMQGLWDNCPLDERPDLYLWVQSVNGYEPQNLDAITCPKACYFIDSHYNVQAAIERSRQFDYLFIAQHSDLQEIRQHKQQTYWLPLGCDPEIHGGGAVEKKYDLGFVGNMNPIRTRLLEALGTVCSVHVERSFFEKMSLTFSASRLALNNASYDDLNMRFFEVLCTGSLLLTNETRDSGQDVMFHDGEDIAVYHGDTICETARFYLENEELREQVAARGRQLVLNAHTYDHRVRDLIDVVLNGKIDTFSAQELREKSLVGVPEPLNATRQQRIYVHAAERSFIIPVLDYSPASEYNITTLLKDLEHIPGEVIVIFNSERVADEMKHHPRINHYAVMKRNVGVSRGWNIGLNIAESRKTFILNADLHVLPEAIATMERYLDTLESAACVGPQGSFVSFTGATDYCHFDSGSFDAPIAVDAVSGFLFCVDRHLLADHGIHFENDFTPCYFEEWDIGLQLKRAGLKSYIVPTSAYDHHWSGTIRALRTIPFYYREETAGEILKRNRQLFLNKWRGIARRDNDPGLLESGWKAFALQQLDAAMQRADFEGCAGLLERLRSDFPGDASVRELCNRSPLMAKMMKIYSAKAGVTA